MYNVIQINRARTVERHELDRMRHAIQPYLQAEQDRRYLRALEMSLKMEEEVMGGVEGWKVGEHLYKTRWMPHPGMPKPSWWLASEPWLIG